MSNFRDALPQLKGGLFLTDAGLETDLIFNHNVEIPEFAAHTLLADSAGRHALTQYFRGFLELAKQYKAGFILDSQTWKAHSHWAADLGMSEPELAAANRQSIDFIGDIRDEYDCSNEAIVLNAVIGPCGDAYSPEAIIPACEAEEYHAQQLGWLAGTDVDMVTAMTFTQASEAEGIVKAATKLDLPIVVSFTVETDGRLPTGQPIIEAIREVDTNTGGAAAYFMINCAHPDHFAGALKDSSWVRRIKGLRCNASRCSHAELDEAETLDDGDPLELAELYAAIRERIPSINVLGGCCGSDLRHVSAIAAAVVAASPSSLSLN